LALELLVKECKLDHLKTYEGIIIFRQRRMARLVKQVEELRLMKRLFEVITKGLALNNGQLVFFTYGTELPEQEKLRSLGFYITKRVPVDQELDAKKAKWRWEFNL
jgi:hypothetical protein